MNIKPDDKLALQVKSKAGNEGSIVEVVKFLGVRPFFDGEFWSGREGSCWLVKYPHPVPSKKGTFRTMAPIPDAWLTPIRDQPGNESWFTAAPRSKPATTKQDTIDARGMVRS